MGAALESERRLSTGYQVLSLTLMILFDPSFCYPRKVLTVGWLLVSRKFGQGLELKLQTKVWFSGVGSCRYGFIHFGFSTIVII
jgi:hypothetical protein